MITECIIGWLIVASLACQIGGVQNVGSKWIIGRWVTETSAELVMTVLILAYLREVERRIGKRKLLGLLCYSWIFSWSLELLASVIWAPTSLNEELSEDATKTLQTDINYTFNNDNNNNIRQFVPSGPYFFIYSLLLFYIRRVPVLSWTTFHFRFFSLHFPLTIPNHLSLFLFSFQLAFSRSFSSLFAALFGILAGLSYFSDSLPLSHFIFPSHFYLPDSIQRPLLSLISFFSPSFSSFSWISPSPSVYCFQHPHPISLQNSSSPSSTLQISFPPLVLTQYPTFVGH